MTIKRNNKHRPPRGQKIKKANNVPHPTQASIAGMDTVGSGNVSVTFDVPVVVSSVPLWLKNGTVPAAGFVQGSPTDVTVTFGSDTVAATSMVVPVGDGSIKSASGGLVPQVTYAVPFP